MDDRTEGAGGMTSGSPKKPSKLAVVLAAGAVLCALIGVIAWQGSRRAGNYMDLQTKAEKASTGISADDVMRTEGAVAGTSRAETAETAAPAAATTAILAAKYDGDAHFAATIIFLSTILRTINSIAKRSPIKT
jgi:predicted permease